MKQRIFSGIQPSGNLHIGNYLGAIKNWVKLQDAYDSIFCVVDLHAITVPQDPEKLRQKTIEIAKIYLAAGIDPAKCSIFIQSHVSEHAELMWILNTITKTGELYRMTQFKDKAGLQDIKEIRSIIDQSMDSATKHLNKHTSLSKEFISKSEKEKVTILEAIENSREREAELFSTIKETINTITNYSKQIENLNHQSTGLLNYPVLMAADILLYDTELVPVGKDQMQHVELTRTLARRFNDHFGETFAIPKSYVKEEGMNIMGLDDPTKKMSKSAKSEYNYISLIDDPDTIRKKIKKAVTDSGSEIVYADEKPALKNLINIYSLLADISTKEVEKKYEGKGYADFKADLAEVIIAFLQPFQKKMAALSDEKVLEILREGAEKVSPIAKKKLDEVKEKIGFIL